MKVQLSRIAQARSGDKGDGSNVGVMARSEVAYAFLKEHLTAEVVRTHFAAINKGDVVRFALAMQERSYVGDDDPAYMARLDKKADRVANQARVIYLGLLGSLLVSAFLATLIVARSRPRRQRDSLAGECTGTAAD